MSEPVELSVDEALSLLRQAEEERLRKPPITTRQRLYQAIPLLVTVLIFAIILRISHRFYEMYKEMEIENGLPSLTNCVIGTATFVSAYPWILTAGLFAAAWLYLTYISGRKQRSAIFNALLCFLVPAMIAFSAIALTLPTIGVLEKIGK